VGVFFVIVAVVVVAVIASLIFGSRRGGRGGGSGAASGYYGSFGDGDQGHNGDVGAGSTVVAVKVVGEEAISRTTTPDRSSRKRFAEV
jgi:hypothetical protein